MNDAPDVKVSDDQTVVPAWFAVWLLIFGAVIPALWDPPFWAVTLGLVLLFIIVRRRLLGKVWLALPLIGYLGWITLSLVWSVAPVTTVPQLFITLFTAAFGLLIAVGRSVRDLLELSVKAVAVVLIGSWLIAVLVPSLGISSEPGRSGAMQGLFNNKNAFGLFTTVALVTTTCHAIATRHDESKRRLAWAGVGLAAVSMLASTSRTALLVSVTLAVLGLALRRLARARRPLGLPVLGLTMTLGLLAATVIANFTTVLLWLGRDPTLTGRTHIWSVVIGAINERPLTGFGYRALWLADSEPTRLLWARNFGVPFWHAHNGYLDIAVQLGLIGLLLAVLLPGWVAVKASAQFLSGGSTSSLWPLLLVALIASYNTTEVVGFSNLLWVLIVALSSILPNELSSDLSPGISRPGTSRPDSQFDDERTWAPCTPATPSDC